MITTKNTDRLIAQFRQDIVEEHDAGIPQPGIPSETIQEWRAITTIKAANTATGGLSVTSKMRGYSYGIPAIACKVGAQLHKVAGSVCEGCYALKGNYQYPSVMLSQNRRLALLNHPQWTEGMIFLLRARYPEGGEFRWHDSGDLQSLEHLQRIVEVCKATPEIRHWIPTREKAIVRLFLVTGGTIPENLTIRVSASMVGRNPPKTPDQVQTSTVSYDESERKCPAYAQNGACNGPAELQRVKALIEAGPGTSKASRARHAKAVRDLARWDLERAPVDCDACWRRDVPNVDYPLH
jgi:hypothetical protein